MPISFLYGQKRFQKFVILRIVFIRKFEVLQKMALIIDNTNGRRMIKLSVDDVLMVISLYQQKCNCKDYTYEQVRIALKNNNFYLPEDFR